MDCNRCGCIHCFIHRLCGVSNHLPPEILLNWRCRGLNRRHSACLACSVPPDYGPSPSHLGFQAFRSFTSEHLFNWRCRGLNWGTRTALTIQSGSGCPESHATIFHITFHLRIFRCLGLNLEFSACKACVLALGYRAANMASALAGAD